MCKSIKNKAYSSECYHNIVFLFERAIYVEIYIEIDPFLFSPGSKKKIG